MPIARIQLPDGRVARLNVPEGTSQEEVMSFVQRQDFDAPSTPITPIAPQRQPIPVTGDRGTLETIGAGIDTLGRGVLSVAEPALTVATGALAEPAAGIAGIATGLSPFAEEGDAARAVQETREALTFQPRTEEGRAGLRALGETLAPVGEVITGAETALGDTIFKATNSPTLAAAAATLPTAILETIGLKGGGRIAKSTKDIKPSERAIKKSFVEAAPEPEALKDISRGIYKELDDSGVSIKENVYKNAVAKIKRDAKKSGLSSRTTPRAMGAIEDFEELVKTNPPLSEIDDLRKVAQGVARSPDRTEAALGGVILNGVDEFLDTLDEGKLLKGDIPAGEIGPKYKAARNLWGRARKSEVVSEAIERARDTASGFENGLRIEFGKIIKNKKTNRYFNDAELDTMKDLVRGDLGQNVAKLFGKFGVLGGRDQNVLGALVAGGIGSATGGLPGFIAAVSLGSSARKISQKLTKNKADFVNAITRAGESGKEITKAYLKTVPKKQRSVADLSELLSDPKVDIGELITSSNKLIQEAAEIAAGRQAIGETAGLATAAAASRALEEQRAQEEAVRQQQSQTQVAPNDLAGRIAEAIAQRRGQ